MHEAKNILIAYASKYGSTQEIADHLARTLSVAGHKISIKPVTEVNSIRDFDAIILGSSIYFDSWLPEAENFLKRFEVELVQKVHWIFSVGVKNAFTAEGILDASYPTNLKAILERIKPRHICFFAGKVNPETMDMTDWLVNPSLRQISEDYRDWVAMKEWANDIAEELKTLEIS